MLQSTTSVLQSIPPVLQRTTTYYSVLQSTTPVLLCTTKYYPCTTLYHKVLLRTTKHYFSTTLYYKALLQYYSVLQSTTPVILLEDSITWRFYHLTILLLGGSSPFTATSACSDMCPDYSLQMWPNECNVQHVKMISPLFLPFRSLKFESKTKIRTPLIGQDLNSIPSTTKICRAQKRI